MILRGEINMAYKKILTIQDISCVGQCSLTVALPVISACGVETCVLPSAVLSTHTAEFKGFTFRDLTEDIPSIKNHWKSEGISFDALYTGYLGSTKQIDYVLDIYSEVCKKDSLFIVDPAMADNGKLYVGFDMEFVDAMKKLCTKASYILPNITEACLLTGIPYETEYDRSYIDKLISSLLEIGCKNIILSGVAYSRDKMGVAVYENGKFSYYEHDREDRVCHGTGDIYASAFVGAVVRGKTACDAARIAADYVVECIKKTAEEDNHWYGVKFEPSLIKLIEAVNE